MAKQIGFWKERVRNCPDLDWFQSNEYLACLKYLQAGHRDKGYKGWAKCRICGVRLGTYDMITPDKKWIFPEEYDHYLTEHKIKPNKLQFILDAIKWCRNNT